MQTSERRQAEPSSRYRTPRVRLWKWLRETTRITIAVLLVRWMFRSGKLDPQFLQRAIQNWPEIFLAVAILYGTIMLMSWRWSLLLRVQHVRAGVGRCFALNMIGLCFGFITPGATGGDVAKSYYIGSATEHHRVPAVATVFIDRTVGLFSLLLISLIAMLLNLSTIWRNPFVRMYCVGTAGFFVLGATLFVTGVAFGEKLSDLVVHLVGRLRLVTESLHALAAYRRRPGVLVQAFGLSLVTHLAVCFVFLLLLRITAIDPIASSVVFLTVPVAFLSFAIPLTPGAIGVGQVAFFTLFQLIANRGADGAAALTLYQALYGLISLSGIVFYVIHRHRQPGASASH